jgi:hypothetical protein
MKVRRALFGFGAITNFYPIVLFWVDSPKLNRNLRPYYLSYESVGFHVTAQS